MRVLEQVYGWDRCKHDLSVLSDGVSLCQPPNISVTVSLQVWVGHSVIAVPLDQVSQPAQPVAALVDKESGEILTSPGGHVERFISPRVMRGVPARRNPGGDSSREADELLCVGVGDSCMYDSHDPASCARRMVRWRYI